MPNNGKADKTTAQDLLLEEYVSKSKIYKEQQFTYNLEIQIRLFSEDILAKTKPSEINDEFKRALKKILREIC